MKTYVVMLFIHTLQVSTFIKFHEGVTQKQIVEHFVMIPASRIKFILKCLSVAKEVYVVIHNNDYYYYQNDLPF